MLRYSRDIPDLRNSESRGMKGESAGESILQASGTSLPVPLPETRVKTKKFSTLYLVPYLAVRKTVNQLCNDVFCTLNEAYEVLLKVAESSCRDGAMPCTEDPAKVALIGSSEMVRESRRSKGAEDVLYEVSSSICYETRHARFFSTSFVQQKTPQSWVL